MASARDEILNRLRTHQRDIPLPAAWRSRRHFPDLVARFQEALAFVGGESEYVPHLTVAAERLRERLRELGARTVVINPDPPLDTLDWPTILADFAWHVVSANREDIREIAAHADVGISSGTAGLAETGSVIVESGSEHSRLAVLLPPVHIVLLPTSRLTPDLFTWTAARDQPFPASLTIITGPSKTADIEQTLATGVHGPGRFMVILFDKA